jgi:hypothetical protein
MADNDQGDADLMDVDMSQENSIGPTGRPRRSAAVHHSMNGWSSSKRKSEEYPSDEDDEGSEPELGDDEEEDEHVPDESEEDEEEFEDVGEDIGDELGVGLPKPRLVITLPIKAAIGTDGKAKMIRQNVNATGSTNGTTAVSNGSNGQDAQRVMPQERREEKMAEVISVAVKGPASSPNVPAVEPATTPVQAPLTPSSGPSTSLAFRGSPEKPQHVPRPIDVGVGE